MSGCPFIRTSSEVNQRVDADKEQWLDQWGKRLPESCHLLNLGQVKQEAEDLVARDGGLLEATGSD